AQLDGMLAPIRARYRAAWNATQIASTDPVLDVPGAAELSPLALRATATVVAYARATQPTGALPISRAVAYRPEEAAVLDEAAIANLELVETLIGRKKQGSLLDVVDQTVTAPGGRRL